MKITLKSGNSYKLKSLSVDERDELLDSISYKTKDGEIKVQMMHSTMTKFLRVGLDQKVTDDFLINLNFEDKTEIFSAIQTNCMNLGEGKASK